MAAGLATATLADAKPKRPEKGFWRVLVQPHAKWVLHDARAEDMHEKPRILTVETYDVRKIGKADVARLRWTVTDSEGVEPEALHGTQAGAVTQFAVTDEGLYMLLASMDDAAVADALTHKPSRSDPPKPYKGTKLNDGRYLTVDEDGVVCMGQGPKPGDDPCGDETCEGRMCVSATKGIVELSGSWSPLASPFEQK
jgi:hypothetical protein